MDGWADAWQIHDEINRFLLLRIPDEAFAAVTLLKNGQPSKGRTIAKVFAHMHALRVSHLSREFLAGVPRFEDGVTPGREELTEAFRASGASMARRFDALSSRGGLVRGRPPAVLFSYLVAHESHHRGQIVLAMKQSGVRSPDEIRFGIWEHWFRPKLVVT